MESNGLGRTLDSIIGSLNGTLSSITSGLNGIVGSSGNCSNGPMMTMENSFVPIFIILPAIIIGVVVIIKKAAIILPLIAKYAGAFFEAFRKDESSEGGNGWSSPTSSYGAPTSGSGWSSGNTLSRQTAILNAIDEFGNQYAPDANAEGSDAMKYQWQNNQKPIYYYPQSQLGTNGQGQSQPLAAQMNDNIRVK